MAIIKRLSLSVEAKTKKARHSLVKLRDTVNSVGKSIFVIGAASAAGLAVLARDARAAGDRVHKMSKRTGVAVETLSKMEHAADLSGTSMGAFENGIKRMARSASDADNGLSTAKRTFDQLGVSVTNADGDLKSSEELFLESADALSKMENETKRAALAQELFGRSGTQLIPLLENGSKGIREMMNEAETLGYVFDQEAANSAAKLTDTLARAKLIFKGVSRRLVTALIPAAEKAVSWFVEWYKANREVIKTGILAWADRIAKVFSIVASGAKAALSNIQKTASILLGGIGIGEWIDGILDFWKAFQDTPKIADLVWEEIKDSAISTLDFAAKHWINKVKEVLGQVVSMGQKAATESSDGGFSFNQLFGFVGSSTSWSSRGSPTHQAIYGKEAVAQAQSTADLQLLDERKKNPFMDKAARQAIWNAAYDKAVAEFGKPDILREAEAGNDALEKARSDREKRSRNRRQEISDLIAAARNGGKKPPKPQETPGSNRLLSDDPFAPFRSVINSLMSVGSTVGGIATTSMQRDQQQLAYAGAMERGSLEAYQASLSRGMDSPEVKETKKSNELLKRIAGYLNDRTQRAQEVYEELITF